MMEMTNTLNNGMCRCCSSEGTFKDIKTKYHWMGEEEVYADMLTDCFDIKISTPEDMDNGICEVCITQLRNAANFKKQVLHTEAQFKRRLQNKEIKNPIKLESMDEDPIESDHLSDPDFSSNEYEVPIKEELEDKPKAKKRAAKATTSRAKKPKAESEPAKKHVILEDPIVKIKTDEEENSTNGTKTQLSLPLDTKDGKTVAKANPILLKTSKGRKKSPEMAKHVANFHLVMRCSNATPLRARHGLGYACYFCKEQFPGPGDLKQHVLASHQDFSPTSAIKLLTRGKYSVKLDITSLTCNFCFQQFKQLSTFMDHLRQKHDQPIHTDVKNYMLPFKFDSEPFKCVECESEFNSFHSIVEHMNTHYRNFICDVCSAGFINSVGLRSHKQSHDTGDFPCLKCPQVFNSLIKLKNHDRNLHQGLGKRIKCASCEKRFNCLKLKNNHMVKEHSVAPTVAQCKACNKTFSNYANLRVHEKFYHLLGKKTKCTVCEKAFRDRNGLERHMVKHTKVRNFKCHICNKAYGRKNTLTEHLRIHADDRKFKCQHCQMAFVQKCSLKSHLLSKHGVEIKK